MSSPVISVIQPESPTVVMPQFLCEMFSQQREYLSKVNDYSDGSSQRDIYGNAPGFPAFSRKKWTLKPKAKGIELNPNGYFFGRSISAIRSFYLSQLGPVNPFYFYDFSESSPYGNYDPFGSDPNGRFVVRFDGPWQQVQGQGQVGVASVILVELVDTSLGGLGIFDFSIVTGHITGL